MGSGKCAKLISPKTEIERTGTFFFFFGRDGEGVSAFYLLFLRVGERSGTVHRTEGMI